MMGDMCTFGGGHALDVFHGFVMMRRMMLATTPPLSPSLPCPILLAAATACIATFPVMTPPPFVLLLIHAAATYVLMEATASRVMHIARYNSAAFTSPAVGLKRALQTLFLSASAPQIRGLSLRPVLQSILAPSFRCSARGRISLHQRVSGNH